jgi:hypothetical protein
MLKEAPGIARRYRIKSWYAFLACLSSCVFIHEVRGRPIRGSSAKTSSTKFVPGSQKLAKNLRKVSHPLKIHRGFIALWYKTTVLAVHRKLRAKN